ncbi:hypothetical protein ACFPVX_23680 [Cohnella faecalis]|nr:hypothetical protein [Cohnella faecalis]
MKSLRTLVSLLAMLPLWGAAPEGFLTLIRGPSVLTNVTAAAGDSQGLST